MKICLSICVWTLLVLISGTVELKAGTTFLHSWSTRPNSVDDPLTDKPGSVVASAAGLDGSLYITGIGNEYVRSIPFDETTVRLGASQGSYIARVQSDGSWDHRLFRLGDTKVQLNGTGNPLFGKAVVVRDMVVAQAKNDDSIYVCGYSSIGKRATAFVSRLNTDKELHAITSIDWVKEYPSDSTSGDTIGNAIDFHPRKGLLLGITANESARNVSSLEADRFTNSIHSVLLEINLDNPSNPIVVASADIGLNQDMGSTKVGDAKFGENGDVYVACVSIPGPETKVDGKNFTDQIVIYWDSKKQTLTSAQGLHGGMRTFETDDRYNQAKLPMTFVINFTSGDNLLVPQALTWGVQSIAGLPAPRNDTARLAIHKDLLYLLRGKVVGQNSHVLIETLNLVDLSRTELTQPYFYSGSGLAIGSGIVIDSDGQIVVSAQVGRGTFNFSDLGNTKDSNLRSVAFDSQRAIVAILDQEGKWRMSGINRNSGTTPDVLDPPAIALGKREGGEIVWMTGGYRRDKPSGSGQIGFGADINRSTSADYSTAELGGYIVAIDPARAALMTQVKLKIESAHSNGVGPFVGETSRFANTPVNVVVPARIYFKDDSGSDGKLVEHIDDPLPKDLSDDYRRRSTCVGFTVIGRTGNTVAEHVNDTHYSFEITEDTTVRANWLEEYALDVSAESSDETLSDQALAALGDPSPPVGPNWIAKDAEVSASILGTVLSPSASEDGSRFQIDHYKLIVGEATNEFSLSPSLGRIQVLDRDKEGKFQSYIRMSGPMKLKYTWKKQYRVQVSTTSQTTESLPFILDKDGKDVKPGGVGEFWYDANSTIFVGCRDKGGDGEELIGWMNARWPVETLKIEDMDEYPVNLGDLASKEKGPLELAMEPIAPGDYSAWKKKVLLTGPVRVTWRFGDEIYYSTVSIGEAINLVDVKDGTGAPVKAGTAIEEVDTNSPPSLRLVQSPPGSTLDDMQAWDAVGKTAYPLRPGVYFADWKRLNSASGKPVVVQVTAVFPQKSHFRHIAGTPPVELNPSERRGANFLGLKFVDGSEASVNGSQFAATGNGRAVLLFSVAKGDSVATGDLTKETLQVRVVQSRGWNEDYPPEWGSHDVDKVAQGKVAKIGERLSSNYDKEHLSVGYIPKAGLEKNLAPYNVALYGDGSKPGPIFPVNRRWQSLTGLVLDKSLIVVWYEQREGILWPYQPEYFNHFEWPSESRLVIASRLGSEGVDANGNAQLSFDSARFDQVSVYNQPDPSKAGYNPNEEHAFIAPSFAYKESPNPPPTVFALRNDLNIDESLIDSKSELGPMYTSEPYVLAQYRDKATGKWGMKAYRVETEDPSVGGDPGDHSNDGILRVPVAVEGLQGSIKDISIEFDLDNHRQVNNEQRILLEVPVEGSVTPTTVTLSEGVSDQGKYDGTIFTDSATLAVNKVAAPFKGRVQPTQLIMEKLGRATNGIWTLMVRNPSLKPIVADVNVSIVVTTDLGGGSGLVVQRFGQGDWNRVHFPYVFRYPAKVGQPIIPPYPLNLVMSAASALDGQRQSVLDQLGNGNAEPDVPVQVGTTYLRSNSGQRVHHVDHRGQGWVASGDGILGARYFYPLRADFWYPAGDLLEAAGAVITKDLEAGDLIPWLPRDSGLSPDVGSSHGVYTGRNDIVMPVIVGSEKPEDAQVRMATRIVTRPVAVIYNTEWPADIPVLKVGETLTFAGGEFHADFPSAPGLPGVLGWSAGRIVYDSQNPTMDSTAITDSKRMLGRLAAPLSVRSVDLPLTNFPPELLPAGKRTHVKGTHYVFDDLPASLQRRFFYDFVAGKLALQGLVADRTVGDPDLTASPPPLVVLEPNILTTTENEALKKLGQDSVKMAEWAEAVGKLFKVSRNPAGVESSEDAPYLVGLEPGIGEGGNKQVPVTVRGPGLALLANEALLDPKYEWGLPLPKGIKAGSQAGYGYITLVENDHPSLGAAPVSIHVIKIQQNQRYRGAIKTILSDNVFDEKITLRHSGDFGAQADNLIFEWWMREEDGTERPLPTTTTPDPWTLFGKSGAGKYQVDLAGTGGVIIRDNLFFVRYRHVNDVDKEAPSDIKWLKTDWKKYGAAWAGAANSPDIDGHFRPQLVQGWVKRVLDAVNPYEARIRDLQNNTSPVTYASMIQQFGGRYEGDVALNPDKNVIENVGLIELYQTILNRAENLTINLSQPDSSVGIDKALMLAGTRLADFYTILGNESYADALDPTIGFGTHPDFVNYGSLAPTIHAFQNEVGSLLEEELALLRGQDDTMGRPVYNRLMWNFTKGEGEAAYAVNYNITDVNHDGFIDEVDGQRLYPQGHGDAWGHYLSATKSFYELINHPYFNWRSQSELYSLQDVVFKVDYLDERKFARAAAAKAKVGADIVNQTYRARYVTEPDGQWQGYKDSNPDRAWGVTEWARRAGQGALFDWITVNALLPAKDTNETHNALQRIDRTTVTDIAQISANLGTVQSTYDDSNNGLNPLGLDDDVVTFDLDPTFNFVGSTAQIGRTAVQGMTHFKQIYERALKTLNNAKTAFDEADKYKSDLRAVGNVVDALRQDAVDHDLDYRNRLIEIFGTPYEGQIGAGKAYPEGYNGPDMLLYQYVDATRVDVGAVPLPSTNFKAVFKGFQQYVTDDGSDFWPDDGALVPGDEESRIRLIGNPRITAGVFFLNDSLDVSTGLPTPIPENPVSTPDQYTNPNSTLNLSLTASAGRYAFLAPEAWGRRGSSGELQFIVAELLQTEFQLAIAVSNYESYLEKVRDLIQMLVSRTELHASVREILQDRQRDISGIVSGVIIARVIAGGTEAAAEFSEKIAEDFAEAVPTDLPSLTGPGDAGAPVRSGIRITGAGVGQVLKAASLASAAIADSLEASQILVDIRAEIDRERVEAHYEVAQQMQELEAELRNEVTYRIEIGGVINQMRQLGARYRATLQEGFRLMEERRNWNIRVATATQQNRYQDYVFRAARSSALEKYRASFNLAARYVYLAAKAYDFETNLSPNHRASPQSILDQIMQARTLGQLVDSEPVSGQGGLADAMATLRDHFAVLEGQMGFNNPQLENQYISMRNGLFRVPTAEEFDPVYRTGNQTYGDWEAAEAKRLGYDDLSAYTAKKESLDGKFRRELKKYRVADLWNVPEFRRYCRPFTGPANGAQPGLVIPFGSQVLAGRNFFGRDLAGGDVAFDPTLFATKIFGAGIWFKGYDTGANASTPRVYLVPVGSDVMTIPDSPVLETRVWRAVDQSIPVPFATSRNHLRNPDWIPVRDSLMEPMGQPRRFPSFLAAITDPGSGEPPDFSDMARITTRLIGRSVWNTEWLMIIPGLAMNADADAGLDAFLESIEDIQLYFSTYGYSGN